MSRARNIKPGFFKNDLLVELPFEYRLLFVGLWTMADREGRMEDRPTKIRMEVFPADSVDVDDGLQALHNAGFIQRYSVNGIKYLQVLAWCKHQNPHVKEATSTIPAPDKHSADTVPDTTKAITSRADSLIPDSLVPNGTKGRAEAAPLEIPDWLPADAWQDWHQFRNSRKGWTHKARHLSLRKLTELWAQGYDPRAVIEQSIERGWTGLFPVQAAQPRAGPTQAIGKTAQGINVLEGMKSGNRMAAGRVADGLPEVALLGVGASAGR